VRAALGVLTTVLLAATIASHDAFACSCRGPQLAFLSPWNCDDAPLNVHVWFEAPTGPSTPSLVLRAHRGADVATQVRTYPDTYVTYVEMIPAAPLFPLTRYEVATVNAASHPPVTVLGTFKTASAMDTTPPRFNAIGHQRTRINAVYGGGDCSIQGPWIELGDLTVHDDWPDAQLLYGIWSADASGNVNTQRQPDAIAFPYGGVVKIGQSSLCDPSRYALKGPVVTFAIAAFDEAGNASRPIRVRADVTRNTP
jgi:hypothetical protein